MRRLLSVFLCFALLPVLRANAQVEDWIPDIDGVSGKVLEWCMMEHEDTLILDIDSQGVRGMSDSELFEALCDAADEYCLSDYKISRRRLSNGDLQVTYSDIHLRPGLLIAEAYWNDDTSRLSADEKKCLRQLTALTDQMVRQYGYATVDLELAIYDYICEHVAYYDIPQSDSRWLQCTNAANAFLYGWGNCQAFSDLFFLMTMMTGFDSGFVSGKGGGGAHLWNTISIGDENVMVDVTYGNNDHAQYPQTSHYYFNFGLDRAGSHTWHKQVCDPPYYAKRTNDRYTYYSNKNSRFGCLASSLKDAAGYCVQRVKEGQKYAEVLLRGQSFTTDQVHSAIRKALGSRQGYWQLYLDHIDGNAVIRVTWEKYNDRWI